MKFVLKFYEFLIFNDKTIIAYHGFTDLKISNAPKVRKPSCEHVDGQCELDF
jgi:hypothetical protein